MGISKAPNIKKFANVFGDFLTDTTGSIDLKPILNAINFDKVTGVYRNAMAHVVGKGLTHNQLKMVLRTAQVHGKKQVSRITHALDKHVGRGGERGVQIWGKISGSPKTRQDMNLQ